MPCPRSDPSIPAWSEDQLDSPNAPACESPYFDQELDAWVLTRYADIAAAFRASSIFPVGPTHKRDVKPLEAAWLTLRAETMEALSASQLGAWRDSLVPEARALAETLPLQEPVELLSGYARLLCLSLAIMVTGVSREDAIHLEQQAQHISAAAAEPFDPALRARAKSASLSMRPFFHSGPESFRDSGFVAISQTLPRLLGNAWFALIQHPEQWNLLHGVPTYTEQAVEELFRYAGLARTLTRVAATDIVLGGAFIRRGQRVILRIIPGNHDPERFANPGSLNVRRRESGHFTLGAGPHACVAAGLIRMAATAITFPLVQRFAEARLVHPVDWHGGSGFRSPASLWASFTNNQNGAHSK